MGKNVIKFRLIGESEFRCVEAYDKVTVGAEYGLGPGAAIMEFHGIPDELRSRVEEVDISELDTSEFRTLTGMFSACNKLEKIDVSSIDTSNVEDISHMFAWCTSLKELDLSGFDLRKCDEFSDAFSSLCSLEVVKLPKDKLSEEKIIGIMRDMGYSCKLVKSDGSIVSDMD